MKTVMCFLALLALLVCSGFSRNEGEFIERLGRYELFEGKLVINVSDVAGNIRYSVGTARFSGGNSDAEAFSKDSKWFLFPASASEVWVFHGSGPLHLVRVTADSVDFDQSDSNPDLLKQAPAEVQKMYQERVKATAGKDAAK